MAEEQGGTPGFSSRQITMGACWAGWGKDEEKGQGASQLGVGRKARLSLGPSLPVNPGALGLSTAHPTTTLARGDLHTGAQHDSWL